MKTLRILAATAVLALALGATQFAWAKESPVTQSPNSPTSGELVENPQTWDGRTITFTGEAITEAMARGDYAWIHVNDDAYYLRNVEEGAALGGYNSGQAIWIPTTLTEQIRNYGDYTHEGDVVTVVGTFNAACGQHGGDMDIHATSLEVVTVGHEVREPVKLPKLGVAVALLALAAVLWWANRRAQHLETFGAIVRRRRAR
jgi:hypothetical protein